MKAKIEKKCDSCEYKATSKENLKKHKNATVFTTKFETFFDMDNFIMFF